ncbi:hypothetical protein BU15DRAFT_82460 [Melanogaster broomeanus]|nr:hypothetical protein BU15DRAFT_82460 [Melanogaster broomeanus]
MVHENDSLLSKYPQLGHKVSAQSLRYALQRLNNYPLTLRKLLLQVAEYQRIGLDLVAYVNFVQALEKPSGKVNTTFMGAFTGNPDTCQKYFDLGFPVWLIRSRSQIATTMNIVSILDAFTVPSDIVSEPAMHNGVLSHTEFDVYKTDGPNREAFGGMTRTEVSLREQAADSSTGSRGPFTRIISVPPPTSADSGQPGTLTPPLARPTSNQGGKAQKVKSTKRALPYPPATKKPNEALSAAEQSPRRVCPGAPKPAVYPFPPPGLFMTTKSLERKARYFSSWLTVRSAWINRVYVQIWLGDIPTTQMWHDFLNGLPSTSQGISKTTRSAKEVQTVKELFGEEFIDLHSYNIKAEELAAVTWRDTVLDLRDFNSVKTETQQKIIYDLYDHSFRFELLMLDLYLCANAWVEDADSRLVRITAIFNGEVELAQWANPFPERNEGLMATNYRDRVPCIEAFRVLLSAWPSAPSFSPLSPNPSLDNTHTLEKQLAAYYCQTFFDSYGRPPILPHHIPVTRRVYTI